MSKKSNKKPDSSILARVPFNSAFGLKPPSNSGKLPKNSDLKIQTDQLNDKTIIAYEISPSIMQATGEISYLLAQAPIQREYPIHAIQTRFVIPLVLGQAMIMIHRDRGPVAYAYWAWLSDDLSEKMKTESLPLDYKELRSGDNLWVVEFIIADKSLTKECAHHLAHHLNYQPFKAHQTRTTKDPKAQVNWTQWNPSPETLDDL